MRILGKRIIKGIGFLRILPTDEDDLWYLYNLVSVGDIIRTSTHRKIVRETKFQAQTGSKTSEKRRISVLLKVCEVNYWAEQHLLLSIKGRNCQESHWLKLGQYHTYEVELNQQIVIYKSNWDYFHFQILNEIQASHTISEVAALVMEEGVAHLCLISAATTRLKQKIEKYVQKKREKNEQRDKAIQDFFFMCLQALETDQLIDQVKCLIIASPGFMKEDFLSYFKLQTAKEQYKHYAKYVDKMILVKTSSGYLNSLMEVLQDPTVQQRLEHTKALDEVKVLERFFNTLRQDFEKIAYGKKDVQYAHSLGAIQTLMLSDKVARAKDPLIRKEWIRIMDQVKRKGGEVFIFSSLHPSGKQLNQYTGIVAILYHPVHFDYEDEDEEDEVQPIQQQLQSDLEEIKIDENVLKDFDQFEDFD